MYKGRDRVKQVNALDSLAQDIASYSGATDVEDAEAAVDFWIKADDFTIPWWFGDHDKNLLVTRVQQYMTS